MINEKNDLMQDISSENSNNLRKYLLIGGGVFVLFVIGIVSAKFLFSEPQKSDTAVILPPEVTTKTKKDDTALFNDIPVENENEFKKPEIKKTPIKEEVKIENPPKEEIKEEKKSIPKNVVEKPKEVLPKKITPQKPKKEVKKEKNHPVKQTKKSKKYYIQVAATRGKPSVKFLKLIKKNGFEYKIMQVEVNGVKIKRILVGGYSNYKEVKKILPQVKKKISSSAFIKVIK